MALTINNFGSANTQGLEEAVSTVGTPSITATDAHTNYCYEFTTVGDVVHFPYNVQPDAGDDHIVGVWVRFPDTTPTTKITSFIGVGIEVGNLLWNIDLNTDGTIDFDGESGTNFGTSTATPFSDNTWHFLEVYFQVSVTANYEVFVDGVSVMSGTADTFRVEAIYSLGLAPGQANVLKVEEWYTMSGATSAADRLGGCEVLAYRSNLANATGDAGTALDVGTWDLVQTIPFAVTEQAAYNDTGAGSVDTDNGPYSGTALIWDRPNTSSSGVVVGASASTEKLAVSFKAAVYTTPISITIRLRKQGSPTDNLLMSIQGDSFFNLPDGVDITTFDAVSGTSLTTSYVEYTIDVATAIKMPLGSSGELFWLHFERSGAVNAANYYALTHSSDSDSSTGSSFWNGSSWITPTTTRDIEFDLLGIGDITGTINAIKGIWNMNRSGGGGTDHFGLLGNSTDGTTQSADLDPTTSFVNYFMVSEAVGVVPLTTDYCRIGFEMTNAQDFQCAGMLAQILHVPAAVATSFPYHIIKQRRRREMRTLITL